MEAIEVEPSSLLESSRFSQLIPDEHRKPEPASREILFGIYDKQPSTVLTVLLAVQNVITTVGGIILVSNTLAPKLCILPEDSAQAYLVSTTIMMTGISTLFQTIVGVRLPIVQTSGFVYMTSTLSLLNLPSLQCPVDVDLYSMGTVARTDEWQSRVRHIQGAIIVIGFIQMLLGYSGLVGKALKYITPLTVAPTMCIIGLTVFEKGVVLMSGSWIIAIATILLLTLFSQYMRKISISIPVFSCKSGFFRVPLKLFALFSILFSVSIMWFVCVYLTSKNYLSPIDSANTETKSGIYRHAWIFRCPYPFQWGRPLFDLTYILAMLPALFTSIIESVGNYYMCAKMSNLSMPPPEAVDRGIGVQGISAILAGMLGVSSGVSASAENVGNIGITQVCSRKVILYAACIMIFISPFTKFIALLVILPDPVLGAVTSLVFALIVAVALSNLQFINLNSTRNLFILGVSMVVGLTLPNLISTHDNFINTKYEIVNNVIFTIMSSGMFIGGLLGLVLDNTVPGDKENATNPYHESNNVESEYSVKVREEEVYTIPQKLYKRIHLILSIFGE